MKRQIDFKDFLILLFIVKGKTKKEIERIEKSRIKIAVF